MELKANGVDAVINDLPVHEYYIAKSGSKDAKVAVEAPPQKSVVIRKPKVVAKENRPKKGHMEWNDKAGTCLDNPYEFTFYIFIYLQISSLAGSNVSLRQHREVLHY